eukprot:TRINITY_DN757_c2_g1_i2.p1 TRINITY_DN757_c2_g1~~TRINITY_DN757_c2_g1_i2.p1  ORF type:complete len:203 (-),score=24.05 TRINITY_DN757_c2_g1_i2:1024-1632(-)
MATMSGHSGTNFQKVQEVATEMVHNTVEFVRQASFTLKEKMDESGMTEYSQKLASKVMNEGIPTVTHKIRELLSLCWKQFVEFLDSKGYKEPLEQYLIQFRDSPIVKVIWNTLQKMFALVWVTALKIYASFNDKQGQMEKPAAEEGTVIDGALSMNGGSSVATPQATASELNADEKATEGRVTPQSSLHFDDGKPKEGEKGQ